MKRLSAFWGSSLRNKLMGASPTQPPLWGEESGSGRVISPPSGQPITHKFPLIAKFLIPAIKIAAGGRYAPSVRLRGYGVHVGGHSAEGSPAANLFAGDGGNCKPERGGWVGDLKRDNE